MGRNVALRKESVDRNNGVHYDNYNLHVALRKESVDRNPLVVTAFPGSVESLSARRAWIEMIRMAFWFSVALSLSARRAWIEMYVCKTAKNGITVALRKESVDRNA